MRARRERERAKESEWEREREREQAQRECCLATIAEWLRIRSLQDAASHRLSSIKKQKTKNISNYDSFMEHSRWNQNLILEYILVIARAANKNSCSAILSIQPTTLRQIDDTRIWNATLRRIIVTTLQHEMIARVLFGFSRSISTTQSPFSSSQQKMTNVRD